MNQGFSYDPKDADRMTFVTKHRKNYTGEFVAYRIDPSTVPYGKYIYECRHGERDWCTPISIEEKVLVNFAGTFVTEQPIPFPDPDVKYISICDVYYSVG